MKAISQPVSTQSTYAKLLEWGKLITITGGAQAIIQAVNLLSGILTIRLLSTQEYALYTIANTMLGTMTLLADGGISTGVMAQGGKVWQDKEKLGQVLVTGLDLRKLFALGSFLVSVPILLYLLLHHGAGWMVAGSIVFALAPGFFAALSTTQLQVAPKLHQNITLLQQNQLATSLLRFVSLSASILLFPYAALAVFFSGLPQVWGNYQLRKISSRYVDWKQSVNRAIRSDILKLVRRMFPGLLYYCVSGQITIWLISIYGSTTAIAEVGALSRLAMILTVITTIFNTLIVPRFAKMPSDNALLIKRFVQIQLGLFLLSLGVVAAFELFPTQILFVLGSKYSHLRSELTLSAIGSCINLLAGSTFLLYSSRGLVLNQFIAVGIEFSSLLAGCFIFDISSIHGILLLNVFVATIQLLMHSSFFFHTALKTRGSVSY